MISMNNNRESPINRDRSSIMNRQPSITDKSGQAVNCEGFRRSRWFPVRQLLLIASVIMLFTSCGIYTFHDVSVDYSKIKTVKDGFIDNKARYVNPQLSPRLTDNLKQKINNYTKLTLVNSDDANYIITGYISRYDVSLSAISNNQSSGNRLTVAATMTFTNTVD